MEITKIYCDKCKKEIKKSNFQKGVEILVGVPNSLPQILIGNYRNLYLCRDCEKDLDEWLSYNIPIKLKDIKK